MAKKTEAEIDAEVAAELAAEQAAAKQAELARKPEPVVQVHKRVLQGRQVVKMGLFTPFQIIGGDVYTFLDCSRHRAEMAEEQLGVRVIVTSRINVPGGAQSVGKEFFVPWSNITYVVYGV
jgi:hypothetical protein